MARILYIFYLSKSAEFIDTVRHYYSNDDGGVVHSDILMMTKYPFCTYI